MGFLSGNDSTIGEGLRLFRLVLESFLCAAVWAAPARVEISLGKAANDETCTIAQTTSSFDTADHDVFARIVLRNSKPSDAVLVEWVSPSGKISQDAAYTDLPSAARLCVVNELSVAGFAPANDPGRWTLRVSLRGRVEAEKAFMIVGSAAAVAVTEVTVAPTPEGKLHLELTGSGFEPNSVVHIAQYTQLLAWQYFAAEVPASLTPARISLNTASLEPGEYVVVVGTPQGALSAPARFVISSGSGYKFPTPAGQRWIVTQGPYGSFSHWNRSLHAWDIAPERGRTVVAMRPGIAYTHDLGMGRTLDRRSFGNYITIDHGDGEYSHYAHLQTRTFMVKNGDRVAQGQPLAIAGNSGYALGPAGGYHVHVHVTRSTNIAAQSIPFRFEDVSLRATRGFTGPVVSSNTQTRGEEGPVARVTIANSLQAAKPSETAKSLDAGKPTPSPDSAAGPSLAGAVNAAEWWTDVLPVPPRTQSLEVELRWDAPESELDFHLVSPDGKHHGWYGDKRGYSGQRTNPEKFSIRLPQPGQWRLAVQGMRGSGSIPFKIEAHLEKASPPVPRRGTRRGPVRAGSSKGRAPISD